jgi:hypothetical protein
MKLASARAKDGHSSLEGQPPDERSGRGLRIGADGMCAAKKHKMQIKGVGLARACRRTTGARPGRQLLATEKLIAWNSV